MRRILFFLGWLLVLILAQASLNPTLGLLAVLACAVHIGLVLGRRGQPHTTGAQPGRRPLADTPGRHRTSPAPGAAATSPATSQPGRDHRHRGLRGRPSALGKHRASPPRDLTAVRTDLGAPPAAHRPHRRSRGRTARRTGAGLRALAADAGPDSIGPQASLAVISLGLLDATGRPLDDQQLAGALATQVAALIAERHQRQLADVPATDPVETTSSPRPIRLPAADLVDPPRLEDELSVLMDRLRRQASPLEPNSRSSSNTND